MVYTTSLVTKQIGSSLEAADYINRVDVDQRNQVKRIPMILVPGRWGCSFWVCVPQGFRALVASHGKFIEIWDPGCHYAPPWYTVTHLVALQHFVYDTPVKECPTLDNVMVTIDVTLVLHVTREDETLKKFAFNLGPEGLDGMLQQIQQDSVRAMVRKRKYNEIYDLMNADHDEALISTMKDINLSFRDYGVEITAMAVTNVHLPDNIAQDMAQTTIYHNQDEFYKLNQEHKLLVIENEEKEKKHKQAMKEKLEQFEAEQKKCLAGEHAKLDIIRATTKKLLSEIKEQESADIKKIDSIAQLKVAGIDAKKDVELATIKAQGSAEAEQIKVEKRAFVTTTLAEADESVAHKKAESLLVEAEAESVAATQLKAKRTFDEKMLQLSVIQKLASNKDVSISGNSSDNMVAQLLSSSRGAAIMGLK